MATTPTVPTTPVRTAPVPNDPQLADKIRAAGIAANAPKPEANVNAAAVTAGKQAENAPSAPEATPVTSGVSADFIAAPFVLAVDETMLKKTAPRNTRTPEQVAMDTVVKQYHEKWVAADRPSQWPVMATKGAVVTYFSDVDKSAKLRQIVNRSVALHELRVKWGTPFVVTETFVRQQRAKGVSVPDSVIGKEVISFAIMDKRPDALTPEQRKLALDKAQATRKANKA